jgi:hypothetical protein
MMRPNSCLCYDTPRGDVVSICPSDSNISRFVLKINGMRVGINDYEDAQSAASFANRRDFGDDESMNRLADVRVPDELDRWYECREPHKRSRTEGTSPYMGN